MPFGILQVPLSGLLCAYPARFVSMTRIGGRVPVFRWTIRCPNVRPRRAPPCPQRRSVCCGPRDLVWCSPRTGPAAAAKANTVRICSVSPSSVQTMATFSAKSSCSPRSKAVRSGQKQLCRYDFSFTSIPGGRRFPKTLRSKRSFGGELTGT